MHEYLPIADPTPGKDNPGMCKPGYVPLCTTTYSFLQLQLHKPLQLLLPLFNNRHLHVLFQFQDT